MIFIKPIFRKSIYLLTAITLLSSCNVSTTQTKDPILAADAATISSNIANLVSCEQIDVQGIVKHTGKDSVSEVTIKIINGKNVPAAQDQQNELGKEIAQQFKKSLVDSNEYDKYKVLFVTQKSKGVINESIYTGHIYKKEEL